MRLIGNSYPKRTIPTRVGRTFSSREHQVVNPDHPHAGGENAPSKRNATLRPGPSPRGWGEHHRHVGQNDSQRTIPTRVGRTTTSGWVAILPSDHPHAGGENPLRGGCKRAGVGPSLRGWGERRALSDRPARRRTIPTRVGRTRWPSAAGARWPDHPHAGGENSDKLAIYRFSVGPSPRGWGERWCRALPAVCGRTIPTRVGRTIPSSAHSWQLSDHPHAGGENGHRTPQPI